MTGEPFHGKSPFLNYVSISRNYPWYPTPEIRLDQLNPIPTRILDSAFHGNRSLQTIHIPASVETIGDFAFIGATGLRTIYNNAPGVIPQQINVTTFADLDRSRITVHVPAGTIDAFLDAGWWGFKLVDSTGVVSYPPIINFHFYGITTMESLSIGVEGGIRVNKADVLSSMNDLEANDSRIANDFAFWGWFTDSALNVSGRRSTASNVAPNLRRPVVGTEGFDTNRIITREMFERYAQDGEINLHSVWSLWGDVNDDGRVDHDDIDALIRNVSNLMPRPPINWVAADVFRDGVVDHNDIDVLTRNVSFLVPRLVMGQRPEASSAESTPAIWSVSQEVISPTATYVDVRVRLEQVPTGGIHGNGISTADVGFHYDPTFLSNPRLAPATFNFYALHPIVQTVFNSMLPRVESGEMTLLELQNLAGFNAGWIPASNTGGHAFSLVHYYDGVIPGPGAPPAHDIGSNTVHMLWRLSPQSNPTAHVYVTFRFDVAPGAPAGSVAVLTSAYDPMHSGGITGILEPGSVTIS